MLLNFSSIGIKQYFDKTRGLDNNYTSTIHNKPNTAIVLVQKVLAFFYCIVSFVLCAGNSFNTFKLTPKKRGTALPRLLMKVVGKTRAERCDLH